MKVIGIVKDGRPFWGDVERYLKAANASILNLDYKSFLEVVSEKNLDIIVAGERFYKEILTVSRESPKLIITERDLSETKVRGVHLLKWPASKEALLEMTSRLLYISERRIFKTVITISSADRRDTFLGKSMNFSLTGMAFKVDKTLNTGEKLAISFYVPNSEERLKVDAEVMRISTDPDDGSAYYGSRFVNIDKVAKESLERFIKKIR